MLPRDTDTARRAPLVRQLVRLRHSARHHLRRSRLGPNLALMRVRRPV
jgi:hypothetical protein